MSKNMKKTLRFVKVLSVLMVALIVVAAGNGVAEHFAAIDYEQTKRALEAAILALVAILIFAGVLIYLNNEDGNE
jgi:hypothetical protein